MTHFDPELKPRTGLVAAMGGVAITGAVALTAAVVAFGAGWWAHRPDVVEVPRAPTAAELEAACAPEVEEVKDELTTAQTRVAELERSVAEKEGKVADLEGRIARGAEAGRALREELARLKAELAETKEQLAIAEGEKQRLLAELRETQVELEETKQELVVTKEQRDFAREDALANRWNAFVATAQLEICEKGNRKKLGNCRESVASVLTDDARRDRFAHCIRSGQAQPMVHEITNDTVLPKFSEVLPEDVKQVKGWYVEYCDPTLPERADAPLAEKHLPKTSAPSEPASG